MILDFLILSDGTPLSKFIGRPVLVNGEEVGYIVSAESYESPLMDLFTRAMMESMSDDHDRYVVRISMNVLCDADKVRVMMSDIHTLAINMEHVSKRKENHT